MSTLTISIGRGLPQGGQLTLSDWNTFRSTVTAIAASRGTIVQTANGTGTWEGQTEDCFTVSVVGGWVDLHSALVEERPILARLAAGFGQEAIAVSLHDPEFVGAQR